MNVNVKAPLEGARVLLTGVDNSQGRAGPDYSVFVVVSVQNGVLGVIGN